MNFFYHDDMMLPAHDVDMRIGLTGENEKRKPRPNAFRVTGFHAIFRYPLPAD